MPMQSQLQSHLPVQVQLAPAAVSGQHNQRGSGSHDAATTRSVWLMSIATLV
jgi:hypothetical protein